jgi:hypothetical protein
MERVKDGVAARSVLWEMTTDPLCEGFIARLEVWLVTEGAEGSNRLC